MMSFDQRGLCAAEKVKAQESGCEATHSRRKIGSLCGGAVTGSSLGMAMT